MYDIDASYKIKVCRQFAMNTMTNANKYAANATDMSGTKCKNNFEVVSIFIYKPT